MVLCWFHTLFERGITVNRMYRMLRLIAPMLLLAGVAAAARPLNVVILLADDLGWADTGVYGADLHETPHIDRFAASAMRFTDAYAAECVPVWSQRADMLVDRPDVNPIRSHDCFFP